jgi:alginate O-acetyltransferase complex protein AlgI
MLFNSWSFAVFLPVVFALHYAGRRAGWQVGVLTLASFVFYGWADPGLLPLLAASTFINGLCAQQLLTPGMPPLRRRIALGLALGFNLGALAFYKYAGLMAALFLSQEWSEALKETVPLPIGISFYTFQGISLVMESWWDGPKGGIPGLPAPRNAREAGWFHAKVWFFKAFFPQLVAGPIVKAGEFLWQIGAKRLADIDWDGAVKKLILGFFLKMVVADNLKDATAALRFPDFTALPRLNLVALLYGFSFQILADFAGYSLIAQGLAKLFGYELPLNFTFPYLSRSITEFWRRWHISLSTWLRMYLYIPLGGNRHGEVRTFANLFLVMFLGGLWHGAAWSYAVWGTAHGLLLALERLASRGRKPEPVAGWTWLGAAQALLVFNVVSVLWLLFKLPDLAHVGKFLACLGQNPGGVQPRELYVIVLFSLPVGLWHGWNALAPRRATWSPATLRRVEITLYAALLFLLVTNSGSAGEFIYFQF